uniref:Glycosyltransferase 2-like domain-containing protein n=1 Tax=viral metagenome TaxID=1070528 RepID=A0A6C0DQF9_9ZZZZ
MTKTAKERLAEKKVYPTVSVCTPTFNRRPFIPIMLECFRNQTYPKNKIEWIIVDDGTDKIKDLVEQANIPQIKYYEVPEKMTLGAKRNYMHQYATGSIIVYMDDDDYYPPERIAHAVERLEQNKSALCAGSSEIYIYFKHIQKMIQCGPYGPNHATAGTFAFRRELLKITKYEEHAAIAEERAFLKEYTIPFVQLDPLKTILVFSHEHNTFDKRKMLDNPHPDYLKESPKTVDMFIKFKNERRVKHFFMEEVDKLLENYEPGEPKMKPDVLVQIKEIEAKREKMLQEEMAKQKANGPIVLQRPGEEPVELNNAQVIDIINKQQEFIATANSDMAKRDSRITELETLISTLQKQLIEKTKELQLSKIEIQKLLNSTSVSAASTPLQISPSPIFTPAPELDTVSVEPIFEKSKSDPVIILDVNVP